MRAAYIQTCDLIGGPTSAAPGVVHATVPCRYVAEAVQIPLILPLDRRVAYVTMEQAIPVEPVVTRVGQVVTTDYGIADRIAIPAGAVAEWVVLFVELVRPYRGQALYYRAHVAQLPFLADPAVEGDAFSDLVGDLTAAATGEVTSPITGSVRVNLIGFNDVDALGEASVPISGVGESLLGGTLTASGDGLVL